MRRNAKCVENKLSHNGPVETALLNPQKVLILDYSVLGSELLSGEFGDEILAESE